MARATITLFEKDLDYTQEDSSAKDDLLQRSFHELCKGGILTFTGVNGCLYATLGSQSNSLI